MENYTCNVSNEEKKITFTILSTKTILDDEISMYDSNDEVNVKIVDKMVEEFNRLSNGLIAEYNYRVIDKKNINLEILFKHVFNKFGETRRYVNYILTYDKESNSVTANLNNGNIGLKNIQNCQHFPFDKIDIKNTKQEDGVNKTIIVAYSNNPIQGYKNYKMIIDFTKRVIYDNFLNIDNYIKISKNK